MTETTNRSLPGGSDTKTVEFADCDTRTVFLLGNDLPATVVEVRTTTPPATCNAMTVAHTLKRARAP
jgi:hypothetical protein